MEIVFLIVGLLVGAVLAYVIARFLVTSQTKRANDEAEKKTFEAESKLKSANLEAKTIAEKAQSEYESKVSEAKREAESLKKEAIIEAKDEIFQMKKEAEDESRERMSEVRSAEGRITQREELLDRRTETLDSREEELSNTQEELNSREEKLQEAESEVNCRLEKVAGMTSEQAKEELLENLRGEIVHESAEIIKSSEERTKTEANKRARQILSVAIQRVAADHSAESTVTTVSLTNDEIKGRIIGREGRNIRSIEQTTGVDLLIDDTPECVTISCFDPVRREIARVTLENLIADGRIHPARIEETYKKAVEFVDQRVQEAGEQATFDVGIHDLHPELVKTIGKLRYRTSFGQNVLNHSLEVAYIAGVMASELGLDPIPAKRAGLLHDIGKAIDHDIDGSHAVIGADLARRFDEDDEIVHAIEAHHNDVEPNSVIDVLVQASDAVSSARPGARRETLDAYIKRLEKLEEIANAHDGVERTYAIQAGRELRVMVKPEVVDEASITVLAHDIAKTIEAEMKYPGQIKVMVIRETRAEDVAN